MAKKPMSELERLRNLVKAKDSVIAAQRKVIDQQTKLLRRYTKMDRGSLCLTHVTGKSSGVLPSGCN